MSGRGREEVLGRNDLTMSPPELTGRVRGLHARALAGENVVLETVRVRKDGRRHDVELRGVPIRHQGEPHVLYIGRDLSERKALESRLRQAQKMEARDLIQQMLTFSRGQRGTPRELEAAGDLLYGLLKTHLL